MNFPLRLERMSDRPKTKQLGATRAYLLLLRDEYPPFSFESR
jgi:hypothetical protein